MRVLLDEQLCEVKTSTIGEAIAGAAAIAEQRHRVITEVIVDGSPWAEAQLASTEMCEQSAGELRLISADLEELVAQTLDDASGALAEADTQQREAAELIQAGRTSDAMPLLDEALGVWLAVQEAVAKSAQALDLDLETLHVGGETMQSCVERLAEHLRAVRGALEEKDPVRLSDTLLYEGPERVDEWRQMLMTIREHIRGES